MTYTTSSLFGPEATPKSIQYLIFSTCAIAIFAAMTESFFSQIIGIPGLQTLLSLSWFGMRHYFLWQPLSFLFVQADGVLGITLPFLIGLGFNMYILWIMGSAILESVGTKPFLRLYFLCGIGAGLVALFVMSLTGRYGVIAGAFPSILAIMTVWTMLNADASLLLYFLFPIKAKWLLAGILGAILLVNISQGDWVSLALYFSGAMLGYLYAVMAWGLKSPYTWTHGLDRLLSSWRSNKSKIIDIRTIRPPDDDEHFVDAMLAKIAKKGERSLTWRERYRLNRISKKKRK